MTGPILFRDYPPIKLSPEPNATVAEREPVSENPIRERVEMRHEPTWADYYREARNREENASHWGVP